MIRPNPDFDLAIEHWLIARQYPLNEDQMAFCGDMAMCFRHCDDEDNAAAREYMITGHMPYWMYVTAEEEWVRRGEPTF